MYIEYPDISKVFKVANYSSCIPIVAGLSGIDNMQSADPITSFINKLKNQARLSFTSKCRRILSKSNTKEIVQNWLQHQLQKQVKEEKLILNESCSSMLAGFYESQGEISKYVTKMLSKIPIVFTNIMFHHDIGNAIYLFNKLNSREIHEISITDLLNKKFAPNTVELFRLYFSKEGGNTLTLRGGETMKIFSSLKEKNITIQLTRSEKGLDTHTDLLLSAMTVVDSIVLDYSLINYGLYDHIRMRIDLSKSVKISSLPVCTVINNNYLKAYSDAVLFGQRIIMDFSACPNFEKVVQYYHTILPNAEELDLSFNRETSSKFMNVILDKTTTCDLKTLKLRSCNPTDEHIHNLQARIPSLVSLNVAGNNQISSKGMKFISGIIIQFKKMKAITYQI